MPFPLYFPEKFGGEAPGLRVRFTVNGPSHSPQEIETDAVPVANERTVAVSSGECTAEVLGD